VLAQSFATLSGRIGDLQRTTDVAVQDAVNQLNALASRVAGLNGQIAANGADVETLKDQRADLLGQLSALADISVVPRSDGQVDVTVAGGRGIVIGANAYAVGTTATPPNGFSSLTLSDFDITSQVTNGRLGGLLALRDTVLPGYQSGLDQLAYDVATQVNAVHATGFDALGAPAGNFFTPPATVAGAASTLGVDPALLADSRLVAGSGTGAAGDNQTARALAALRDARVMSGGTATAAEAWSNLVYRVGSDVATAQASSDTRDAVVRQLQQLRDQTSGVSFDEEAANMLKFQRAYEANARFFTTINTTLDTLLTMVR
jgi:flagellar hook-associated protein 1